MDEVSALPPFRERVRRLFAAVRGLFGSRGPALKQNGLTVPRITQAASSSTDHLVDPAVLRHVIEHQAEATRQSVEQVIVGLKLVVEQQTEWIRKLVSESDRSSVSGGNQSRSGVESELAELRQTALNYGHVAVRRLIPRVSASTLFECTLNGVPVRLPRDTLRILLHCVFAMGDGPLTVNVETAHYHWLRELLRPGDTFVDVGAAAGTMTLPLAVSRPGIRVIAFEPAKNARRLLEEGIAANGVSGVEVCGSAVAAAAGTAEFAELGYDPSGQYNFMPEMSALDHGGIIRDRIAAQYTVPVVTLNDYFADADTIRAVKIDVEGFEVQVLDGGLDLFRRTKPHLAIDIHADPFAPGTTDVQCRERLGPLGYSFERIGHVLLCTPPVPLGVSG